MNNDSCDIYLYDEQQVNNSRTYLEGVDTFKIAQMLKTISEETRTKIAYALLDAEELCVCDIANVIDATIANTSSHLRKMHKQGIVKFEKKGKMAFYSLDDNHIKEILAISLAHIKEGENHDK